MNCGLRESPMRQILAIAILVGFGSVPAVAQDAEVLRQRAVDLELECARLDSDARRAQAAADSTLATVASPPDKPVLTSPYQFQVKAMRLAVRIEPGSSETSFTASRGDTLTAVRMVPHTSYFVVEVVTPDGTQRGYVSATVVGGDMNSAISAYYRNRRAYRDMQRAYGESASAAQRDAQSCWNWLGDLRNRATGIEEAARRIEEAARTEAEFYSSTPDVLIDGIRAHRPNSADGVDFSIQWRFLNPHKTIRYIHFTVRPYNRVGDVRRGRIGGHSDYTGYITGPLEASPKGFDNTWGVAWYNRDISCVRLTRVRIEYTDGSSYTYVRELPSILAEGVTNSCTMEAQR